VNTTQEIAELRGALDAANALIGETAEECRRVNDALRAELAAAVKERDELRLAVARIQMKASADWVQEEGTVEGTLKAAKVIVDSGMLDRVMRP
jgi:hypothetical protein